MIGLACLKRSVIVVYYMDTIHNEMNIGLMQGLTLSKLLLASTINW